MTRTKWVLGAAAIALILGAGLVVSRNRTPASPRAPAAAEEAARGDESGQGAQATPGQNAQRPREPGQGGDRQQGAEGRRGGGGPPAVGVANPRRVDLPTMLALTANIRSVREAGIFSKVAGYLEQVTVRPGDTLRAGQVVAVVDHAQLQAQVVQAQAALAAADSNVRTAQAQQAAVRSQILNAQAARTNAEAQVAAAQAGVTRVRAQLDLARANHARMLSLFQQGMVARQRLDEAEAEVKSVQANLEAAQAQVRVAEAQIAAADAQIQTIREQEAAAASQVRALQAQAASMAAALDNTKLALANATIRAPWSGVVVTRNLDPGAFVTPGAGAQPILTIADLGRLNIIINVPETEMAAVRRGDAAQITVDAFPDKTFKGKVTRIAGGVDVATRTVTVEIEVSNPENLLRPGMYAKVNLSAGSRPAVVVPVTAVVAVRDQQYVWVIKDGTASRRAVTLGRVTGEVVEIVKGLSADEVVVVRGTSLVRDGRPVRPVPEGPQTPRPESQDTTVRPATDDQRTRARPEGQETRSRPGTPRPRGEGN